MNVHDATISSTRALYTPQQFSRVQKAPNAVTASPAAEVSPASNANLQPITLEGLMEAWGKNDPHFDLNGDGTVNVLDLLQLLSEMGPPAPPRDAVPSEFPADAQAQLAAPNETEPSAPEQPEQPSLDGLLAAWGTDDPTYDLNGDGTVDVLDLLAFLGQSQSPSASAVAADPTSEIQPAPAAGPGETDPNAPPTVAGLLAAWGKDDSTYDLNGDGTVDVLDLLQLLAQSGPPATGGQAAPAELAAKPDAASLTAPASNQMAAEATNVNQPGDPAPAQPITIGDLIAAWGKDDPTYDLNGDGTVDVLDLLQLISEQGGKHFAHRASAALVKPLAASLVNTLQAAGYEANPPSNLHSLLAQLQLGPFQQRLMLDEVNARYPHGLGVNIEV